jgi:hypothetical protein
VVQAIRVNGAAGSRAEEMEVSDEVMIIEAVKNGYNTESMREELVALEARKLELIRITRNRARKPSYTRRCYSVPPQGRGIRSRC